jgi:lysozyme
MVSLAYNIGMAAFGRSSVLHRHNAGAHDKAADAFLLWNKAGGKVLPGLVRRRNAERALYLGYFVDFERAIGFKA